MCNYHFVPIIKCVIDIEEDANTNDVLKEELRNIMCKISSVINDTTLTSIDALISKAEVSHTEYTQILQTSMKGTTIVKKRSVDELFINYYNANLLKAWRANMDIQGIMQQAKDLIQNLMLI